MRSQDRTLHYSASRGNDVIGTGVSGCACAVVGERGVDARAAVLTGDVMTVVNVDVTGVTAEAGVAETHGISVVQDTVGRVYSARQAVLHA